MGDMIKTRYPNKQKVFALERAHAKECGFEGTVDEGQEYLHFKAK